MTINTFRGLGLQVAIIATALLMKSTPVEAQTINLMRGGDPTAGVLGIFPTAGQTFTVPTGYSFLQSFSLWLSNDPSLTFQTDELSFRAYIAPWTGTSAGAPIYQSATFTGVNSQAYPQVSSLNLNVTAGNQYVAFVSSAGLPSNPDAYAAIEMSLASYAGGEFVFTDGDFTQPWFEDGSSELGNAQFSATFSAAAITAVPEPSTLILLAFGFGVLFALTSAARARSTALD